MVAATALVMGTMIASGVFLLPAILAPFGWNSVGGWVLTIAGALVSAKVLADLTLGHIGHANAAGFVRAVFGPVPERVRVLLLLSTWATLWLFLAITLAALRLGVSRGAAILGAAYALWTLWDAGLWGSGLSLVLMIAGLPLYGWARRVSAKQAVEP